MLAPYQVLYEMRTRSPARPVAEPFSSINTFRDAGGVREPTIATGPGRRRLGVLELQIVEVLVDLRLRLARGDVLEGEGGHRSLCALRLACRAASTAGRALGLQLWVWARGGRKATCGAETWHEGYPA